MMVSKAHLSFILDGPAATTSPHCHRPTAHEAHRLPSKKRPLEHVHSPMEAKPMTASCMSSYSPLTKKQAKAATHGHPFLMRRDGVIQPKTKVCKTPLDKRQYNRERQQNLRRQETHERQSLRLQVQEFTHTCHMLQSSSVRRHRRAAASDVVPADDLRRLLATRSAQYASFTQDMARWTAQLVLAVDQDDQWLASLAQEAGETKAGPTTTSPASPMPSPSSAAAAPLPPLDVDLSDLPPSSRKRMYNRLRQRLYRERELNEVASLNNLVGEYSQRIAQLKAGRSKASSSSSCRQSGQGQWEAALQQNHQLKARLRQYAQWTSHLEGWVSQVTTHLEHDAQFVASV
ncbi:Aste57867_21361 [Aphanomyces stellatus]|uniref:Aste57867_21361 protein n=1 Tax=Aphanomyces stellatus TaxID=120398 RepID=A0A485LHY3_9STRA|nr:hypothetical protein As57867_021292 [Aphanomyces stellatus]VFT98033.1 Aste57867_21361 [Aphanomyces stellatus]